MPELNKTRIYSGSISEGFEKAKQYFKKDVGQLEYRLISSDGDGEQKYLLEFSVKSSDVGQKGKLFENVFLDDFDVAISKDRMKAFVLIPPNPRIVDKQYLLGLLSENGVNNGIIEERLDILVKYLENKNIPFEPTYLVAEGKQSKHGYNAEALIKSDEKDDDFNVEEHHGRVDYKNLKKNKLGVVKKDSIIAHYIPNTKGEDGFSVTGEILKAEDGKELKITVSENVVRRDNNFYTIIDGLLEYNFDGENVVIKVSNVYVVNGNVDFKTGNIEFPGSMIVSGEIMSGFSVVSGENVIAKVISGDVKANGNIIVKEGIIGSSIGKKNKIRSGGFIEANFIQYADVTSALDVRVKTMIRDSHIITDGKIVVDGHPGSIFGGVFYATKGLEANSIGSPSFSKTKIVVGASAKLISDMMQVLQEKDSLERKLQQIMNFLGVFEKRMNEMDDDKKQKVNKLVEEKRQLRRKLFQMYTEIDQMKQEIKKGVTSEIMFKKDAMPGVSAVIGEYFFELNSVVKKGKFCFDENKKEVVIKNL